MSQFTITGFDACAHMSEETKGADKSAPLAIVMAISASAVAGFAYLLAIIFSIQVTTPSVSMTHVTIGMCHLTNSTSLLEQLLFLLASGAFGLQVSHSDSSYQCRTTSPLPQQYTCIPLEKAVDEYWLMTSLLVKPSNRLAKPSVVMALSRWVHPRDPCLHCFAEHRQ